MLTIFTPTYNRSEQLQRLFQSLVNQKEHDFEWLVIDDGSTDDTRQHLQMLREKALFPVHYVYQENGGKHRAYNRALELARGDWFLCVDSDDWLSENALGALCQHFNERSAKIIVSYKTDERGRLLSDRFPQGNGLTSLYALQFECGCHGEFSLAFRTDYARCFPFPVFQNERFLTEAVVYDRMAKDNIVSVLPEVITVCEYQPGGLTGSLNRLMRNNPAGFCLYFMQRIDLQRRLSLRVETAGKYHAFQLFSGKQRSPYIGTHPGLVKVTVPLGVVFWIYYKLIRNI